MSGYAQEKSFAVVAEARRKWTAAEKQAIVAETKTASVSSVARWHGISSILVFRWQCEIGSGRSKTSPEPAGFVPARLSRPADAAPVAPMPGDGLIEIVLCGGHRVRVDGSVDGHALRRVLAVLDGR